MAARSGKPSIDKFEPSHNVSLWLHRLNTERTLRQWQDAEAVAQASLLVGDVPLTWMLNNCNADTTWAEFVNGMKARFGENEQTILARITHRKQHENENVQAYVDEMNMLFSQTNIPDAMKSDILTDNLKPSLRTQVVATIPRTMQQVIDNATYLEERANGAVADRLKRWDQQQHRSSSDPVERITKSMEKMTLALNNNFNRQGPMHDMRPPNRPLPPRPHPAPFSVGNAKNLGTALLTARTHLPPLTMLMQVYSNHMHVIW
ncbi:TPA: hypothetical protein ACH3X2_006453 [Trebouxia sp. C0005]